MKEDISIEDVLSNEAIFKKVYQRLLLYATKRFEVWKVSPERGVSGKCPEDFVSEILELLIEGLPNYDLQKGRLVPYLLDQIKSRFSNWIRRKEVGVTSSIEENNLASLFGFESQDAESNAEWVLTFIEEQFEEDEEAGVVFHGKLKGRSRKEIILQQGWSEKQYLNAYRRFKTKLGALDLKKIKELLN